jgi:hypothetical protein
MTEGDADAEGLADGGKSKRNLSVSYSIAITPLLSPSDNAILSTPMGRVKRKKDSEQVGRRGRERFPTSGNDTKAEMTEATGIW